MCLSYGFNAKYSNRANLTVRHVATGVIAVTSQVVVDTSAIAALEPRGRAVMVTWGANNGVTTWLYNPRKKATVDNVKPCQYIIS